MTDNKSVTQFLQTEVIPTPFWNACGFVLQFNFSTAHISDKVNASADFLSRLETDTNDKNILEIREDVETEPIEINNDSTGIAQDDQVFSQTNDAELPSEEQLY